MIGDQIGEKGGATLIDVLRQAVIKSLEGSIRELVRELKLKFAQNRRCHASADVVLINIGVAPDLVARSQGISKYPQSNAPKQFQNMETVLQCLGRHFLDGGVDGTCVVHCFPHPGRSRVDGGLMKVLGLLQLLNGVLSSSTMVGHHRLQFCFQCGVSEADGSQLMWGRVVAHIQILLLLLLRNLVVERALHVDQLCCLVNESDHEGSNYHWRGKV